MENLIAILILAVLIGGASAYLIKAKKNGVKCVGCPAGGTCGGKRKEQRKKLKGPVLAKKTMKISGMHCAHCVQLVTESLNGIEGVAARVDLAKGYAELSFDREVDEALLIRAVENKGFSVDSIW